MILPLLLYPNAFLRKVSEPVDLERAKSEEFKVLLQSLTETLVWYRGIGISAVQTGFAERVFVMKLSRGGYQTFVNPVLEEVDGPTGVESMEEGCLSIPGVVEIVQRYPEVIISCDKLVDQIENIPITAGDNVAKARETDLMPNGSGDEVARQVEYLDPEKVTATITRKVFERVRFSLEGIEAQCAQHELDHLEGRMFSDDYGPMKRDIVKRKIKKQLRQNPLFQEIR